MPHSQPWTEPEPHLVLAAAALSAGRPASSAAALEVAEGILRRLPADQEAAGRLAPAMIGLAAARRTGDFPAAAAAAERAEVLAGAVARDKLARHPEIQARVLSGRGAVEPWTGHLDEAARILILDSGVATAAAGGGRTSGLPGAPGPGGGVARSARPRGTAGRRGDGPLTPGEQLPPVRSPNPAALVALAWVHLEHNELREARGRLKQSDTALGLTPDSHPGIPRPPARVPRSPTMPGLSSCPRLEAGDHRQRAPPRTLGDQLGDPRARYGLVRHSRRHDLRCQDRITGADSRPPGAGRPLSHNMACRGHAGAGSSVTWVSGRATSSSPLPSALIP